jgi:D-threo-aldose 1-dehydrogenase
LSIVLPGGTTISQFGFGCSGLMARLNRNESRRLLETAFDHGITHYDVARSYGYGEAESVVGDFIANRRSAVTVTTKAGILPPRKTKLLATARGIARRVVGIHPMFRRRLRAMTRTMSSFGCFDVDTIQQSVETSLRELRTDVIDFLLLHDCTPDDLTNPELLEYLEALQKAGKIRQFGVGTGFAEAARARQTHPALTQVVQFANGPWQPNMLHAEWTAGLTVFTHSAVGPAFAKIRPALAADPALATRWSSQLGFDASDNRKLGEAFLAAALAANAKGCVLFSTQRPEAIASNVKIQPRPDLWLSLCALAKTIPGHAPA